MERNQRFDPSLEALTPEGVKFILFPAGLPVRTLAYAIDQIIQWVIILSISIAGIFLRYTTGIWLMLILHFGINWFYHVICELMFGGQSIGKRLTGIRVIRSDGSPVDPASSFLRNLLRFADTFFFFFPIAFITMSASSGFRRIGDWAGGTLVVYLHVSSSFPQNIADFLAQYKPIVPAEPLSNDEKQAIMNFARRCQFFGESRANEIAGAYSPYIRGEDNNVTDAEYLLGIARGLSGEYI